MRVILNCVLLVHQVLFATFAKSIYIEKQNNSQQFNAEPPRLHKNVYMLLFLWATYNNVMLYHDEFLCKCTFYI